MHIEITAEYAGRSQDVVVEAPEASPMSEVLARIAHLLGAPAGTPAWRHGDLLTPASTLADAALRVGDLIRLGERPSPGAGGGVVRLEAIGGPNAGTSRTVGRGRIVLGRAPDCDLVLADPDASRRHAALDVGATSIVITDLGSTNGTRVDGRLVPPAGLPVRIGSLIALGDSVLTLTGPGDPPAVCRAGGDGTVLVLRGPRRPHVVPAEEIEMPRRPGRSRPRRVQWAGALVPAAGGAALAWFWHNPQFLLFTLLSPLLIVSTALGDRLHWRRERRRAAATHRARRTDADRRVREGLHREAELRRAAAPDPAAIVRQARLPGSRIWERRRGDVDVLGVRLGLASLPATLATCVDSVRAPAGLLDAVPLCVDLTRGPLGIAGPPAVTSALARWVVGQLAVLHSPTDLSIALLLDPQAAAGWDWARWLPQVRGRVAATPEDVAGAVAELASLVDGRLSSRADPAVLPRLVVLVDRAGRLGDVPGLASLLARGAAAGLTAVCVDASAAALPPACVSVAQVSGPTGTRLTVRTSGEPPDTVAVADQVSAAWAEEVARCLAGLVDAGAAGEATLPDRCELLDVLDLDGLAPLAVQRRWSGAGHGARTTLGMAADGRLGVDLARDGPHALIAGTTGSGKSELLQVLVAGLAVNHPPDELNVLLVDYKGGAAFGDCARLPHTAGLVTDLDPYLTERALRALTSELRRRERLFAQAAASDIAGYRAAGGSEQVARLVIVVDEFAALADELPDFLRGLVAVAQRGRSLGVHLVLATQRPGSAVSADIRANTGLRIALRVTDPAESSDVLGAPVAATIPRSLPGRAYLRAGSGMSCFQAAHASSAVDDDPVAVRVTPLGPWRRRAAGTEAGAVRQLSRLVDVVCDAARRSGRAGARPVWLPPLPQRLPRSELQRAAAPSTVVLGRLDLPDEQRVAPLSIDLAAGESVLICGAPRTGRSTALASLALGAASQFGPVELHLHVVDAAGALATLLRPLPHCMTILGPDDAGLAARLLQRIESEAARRLATARDPGLRPWLVLLLDGWDRLSAALPDLDAARCAELLTALTRVGPAAGVTVAVTGDRTALAPRFAGAFGQRILLRQTDRGDYAVGGIAARDVPSAMPPGRGLRAGDGAVVQVAIPDAGAADRIAQLAERGRAPAPGGEAIRIRPLPTRVTLGELRAPPGRLCLGLAGDAGEHLAVDLFAGDGRVLVAGPPRSGRSTVLRLLARQAHQAGIATLVAAPSRSPVAADAAAFGLPVVTPADEPAPAALDVPGTLLLVDDSEAFRDTVAGEHLACVARAPSSGVAVVVTARADELATSYRGVAAEVRRSHCGILLRPGPVDGELLGVRLPRRLAHDPPGRGVAVGDPAWGRLFTVGEPVPIQVATP